MDIFVCMKQTFDTEEKIHVEDGRVQDTDVEYVVNPYDEYAIEEAIRLKEKHGGEVTVCTVGPERAEDALRKALAMGANKGMIVQGETIDWDEFTLSKILAGVVRERDFDLILAGNFAVDSGSGQVAIRLAEELDIPHIGSVTNLEVEDGVVTARRDVEGDVEIVRAPLPALITAQQGLNEPRYPSLPGIMKAKKKPLERLEASDLVDELCVKTAVVEESLPPEKETGRMLEGKPEDQVNELVALLREKENVV